MVTKTTPRTPRASRVRRQSFTLVTGAWVVLGVFVDGWAHLNRTMQETFFTPWHALLYSGAAALFGWLLLSADSVPGRDWALVAAGTFTVGGLGDLVWHQAFGVETGLDALVSPTHLLLLFGGLLGVTAPLRESRRPTEEHFRDALPVLAAMTLATALSGFFLLYVSPFTTDAPTLALTVVPEGAPGHEAAEAPAVAGLAAYLVSTALVVVPVLLLRARRALPFGAITLLVTVLATLSAGITGFQQPAAPVAALLAGLGSDVVVRAVRHLPDSLHAPLVGAVVPLLLWSAQLTALALTTGVRWPVELVTGAPLLSAMLGASLGILSVSHPPATRTGAASANNAAA